MSAITSQPACIKQTDNYHTLVILDRDGVINEDSDSYIRSLAEFIPIPSSIEAIAQLTQAGFCVTIATNQSGIGRGYYTQHVFAQISAQLKQLVEKAGGQIHHTAHCPRTPADNCSCRKPKTGMLEDIARLVNKPLTHAIVVGDSLRDVEAGLAVGARCFLVLTGKGTQTLKNNTLDTRITVCQNLKAVCDVLINHQQNMR